MAPLGAAAIAAMRELCRARVADDVGGLSWPTGKLLLGVAHPAPRDPDEPDFFLYVDLSGHTAAALAENARVLDAILGQLRAAGHGLEDPISVPELVAIEPRLATFADFPTRLDFLLDHPGGGLTWVGTYGPLSHLEEGAAAGERLLAHRPELEEVRAEPAAEDDLVLERVAHRVGRGRAFLQEDLAELRRHASG